MSNEDLDKSHWHYIQSPEEMFLLRRHDFDDDARYLLRKWLRLDRSNLKIVEMGSGSGYFTDQLLEMADSPEIVCVEPDDLLIDYAKEHLGKKVIFRKGFVEDPPLRKDFADLVICHVLLCNVPDIKAAVKGMIRAAKPGGTVCSIEPVFLDGFSRDRRAKLIIEGHSANIEGAWIKRKELIHYTEEYPYSRYIYPHIFADLGLIHIGVHALASSYYSRDWRRAKEDVTKESREWLNLLEKHRERYEANLKRNGWKSERIEAFFKAWRDYHTEAISYPERILRDHNVYIKCNIVTIGMKL